MIPIRDYYIVKFHPNSHLFIESDYPWNGRFLKTSKVNNKTLEESYFINELEEGESINYETYS